MLKAYYETILLHSFYYYGYDYYFQLVKRSEINKNLIPRKSNIRVPRELNKTREFSTLNMKTLESYLKFTLYSHKFTYKYCK